VQSLLIEGRLSILAGAEGGGGGAETTLNQVTVYFDESGQIRLEGMLSREYFLVRGLIYKHFGRI
jgi:hypothetical protein